MKPLPILITVALVLTAVATSQAHAETALVNANNIDLRAKPSSRAKSVAKLYTGRQIQVDVIEDEWVHVTFEIERGRDRIAMAGWLPRKHVRALHRDGFGVADSERPDWLDDDEQIDEERVELDWATGLNWNDEN